MTINDEIILNTIFKVNQRKEILFKFTLYSVHSLHKFIYLFHQQYEMILFGLEYLDEVNFDPKRHQKVTLRTG